TAVAGFTYAWDFGDSSGSNQRNPSHTYIAAGTFTAKLTVTDKDGGSSFATTSVTVAAATAPLSASAGPSKTGNEGSAVTFSGSATGGTAPLSYSWTFGDGGTVTGTL